MSDVPAEAVAVLEAFLAASERKDLEGMKACLTRQTLESGQFDGSGPQGVRMVIGDQTMEGATAVIVLKGYAPDAPADGPPAMEMPCMVVQEDGKWKFDLGSTVERMMGGAIGSAMQQVADGMGQAMEQVGEAISVAMGGGAQSGEDDPAWDQADLTPGEDERFDLPVMDQLIQTSQRVSAAIGADVPVMAATADLLKRLGSDERDQLITWLDGTLFGEWEKTFGVASGVGAAGRLRSVRIEAADRSEDRIITLDGSDLVYRMFLNRNDGYFSDEYIAWLLPGVLAGLPEKIDPATAGRRMLALDVDRPTAEEYRKNSAPRWMRRIRALLGKPIRLDIDWQAAADANNIGPQLPRWGLNRIYGALALVCLDEARKADLVRDLKTIELAVGSSAISRSAKYEDGKLTVGLCYYGGDTPGCYEFEIAAALGGQALE